MDCDFEYKNGYCYKLSYGDELPYFGSSVLRPNKRFSTHKNTRDYSSKLLFDEAKLNGEKPTMEIIFCLFENCRKTRRLKEQEFIDNNPCLNERNAYTDEKEYHKEYQKKYNKLNRERVAKRRKEYIEKHRDKTKEYMKVYGKKWYEEKKENINQKRKQMMSCYCGSIFRIADKTKHYKTKKHLNFIADEKDSL